MKMLRKLRRCGPERIASFCTTIFKCTALAALVVFVIVTSASLLFLNLELRDVKVEISSLRNQINITINTTIVYLNSTVVEAQESMQQKVEDVGVAVDKQGSLMAVQGAGTFAVLSVVIFVWHAAAHLREIHEPAVQRKILAILWMVPVYAVTSWLSLVVGGAGECYLALAKDFYEAYCIYTFLSFLISVLGRDGGRSAVVDLLTDRADHLRPPLECCGLCFDEARYDGDPRGRANAVLYHCQACAMQFVFIRPITSLGMALSNQFYGTEWGMQSPQLFFVIVQNLSIFVAFSGLLKFYHATRDDLAWCNPFPKFMCIKGVVFMTFWQGMAIAILARVVYDVEDPVEWSKRAQNFLVCVEMLFFAIAHCFVFPTEEWKSGYRPRDRTTGVGKAGTKKRFGDNIALNDFVGDVRYILRTRKKPKRMQKSGLAPYLGVSVAASTTVDWDDTSDRSEGGDGFGNEDDQGDDDYIVVYDSKGGGEDDGNACDSIPEINDSEVGEENNRSPLDIRQLRECDAKCVSPLKETRGIV